MPDTETNEQPGFQETSIDIRKMLMDDDLSDPVTLIERVYQIWWRWADFHLYIVSPTIETISPAVIIPPEQLPGSEEMECVYPIHDWGNKLSTSKGQDMYSSGMSMCKLYYTIEKMIVLLVERMKSGGVAPDQEIQVAFGGHELAHRKAFESIINLSENVVVVNFDPGAWGENYLQNVKRMADKGYGYPAEAPRDNYKKPHHSTIAKIR